MDVYGAGINANSMTLESDAFDAVDAIDEAYRYINVGEARRHGQMPKENWQKLTREFKKYWLKFPIETFSQVSFLHLQHLLIRKNIAFQEPEYPAETPVLPMLPNRTLYLRILTLMSVQSTWDTFKRCVHVPQFPQKHQRLLHIPREIHLYRQD